MSALKLSEGNARAAAVRVWAAAATGVLLAAAMVATEALGAHGYRAVLTAAAGLVCLVQAWSLLLKARRNIREREVWRGFAAAAALIGAGLLAEAGLEAIMYDAPQNVDLHGTGLGVGVAAAGALLYQGIIRWNRFKTYLSNPGDWLNGLSAVAVMVAGGGLVVRVSHGPMAGWPAAQTSLWLAHIGAMVVLLGSAATVAVLGGLVRDVRVWALAGILALGTATVILAGSQGDLMLTGAATQAVWVLVVVTIGVLSLLPPARVGPRAARSQAPAVGALVVLTTSIGVLVLNEVAGPHSDLTTTLIAAGAGLGASARMLNLVRDLADLATSQQEARTDDLTGIANRRALAGALAQATERRERAALIIIDLDDFKKVNDRYGHATGDSVLQKLALRLQAHLPDKSLLGRLGGDEFAVLLTGPGVTEAGRLAWSLLRAAGEPVEVEGRQVSVTTSIGVAVTDPRGDRGEELMRRADAAMYTAKRSGGGISTYDEQADRRATQERDRLDELRAVLGRDASRFFRDQIVVHYQPQLEVATGRVVGAEALVRWQHPELGLLYPDAFLGLVERHGLMSGLTRLVLRRATAEAVGWHRAGHRIRVAVNLSTSCLSHPDLLPMVDTVTAETGIDVGLLKLEITETTLMSDPLLALDVAHGLASRGIGISIDDFGTGYSSLAYLNDLPAEELKLDRSFTARLVDEPRTAAIVAGTIDLAHHLGLSLLAEGVEDEPALAALSRLGCDRTQGFLHARPMPGDLFSGWLGAAAPTARPPLGDAHRTELTGTQ